jgi:hypothetical protein
LQRQEEEKEKKEQEEKEEGKEVTRCGRLRAGRDIPCRWAAS